MSFWGGNDKLRFVGDVVNGLWLNIGLRQVTVVVITALLVSGAITPFVSITSAADSTQSEKQFAYQEQPDLTVVDVSWRPSNPSAGETTEFQLTVKNTGEKMAENVELGVYDNGDLAAIAPTVDLGPGEAAVTPWVGSYEISGGDHQIVGKIDFDDHISESDESNNERTESLYVDVSDGRVAGRVTDDAGDPISSALVYLDDTTSTRTDSNGYYEFTGVPTGDHEIEVRMNGYAHGRSMVTVTESDTTTEDFSLTAEQYDVSLSSEPISVYTAGGGTYDYGESVRIEAPPKEDGYEFKAWETASGDVVSTDSTFTIDYISTDYTLVAQYKKPGKPDLVVEDVDWDPTNPDEGDSVDLEVDIANEGEARGSNVGLEVSVGNNVYRDDISLAAGDTEIVYFGPWQADEGADEVTATIDYADEVDEEDEGNNEDTDPISVTNEKPDLEVTDIALDPSDPKAGESVSATVDITNTGEASANNVDTKLTVQGHTLSKSNIDLHQGETKSLSLGDFVAEPTDGSGVTATAVTDYTDEVSEQDEGNNDRSETFTIERRQPDLEVANIEIRPAELTAGERAEFRLTITNTGDKKATDVESKIQIGDTIAAKPPTTEVPAGQTVTTVWSGSYEFTAGTHDVRGVVDPNNKITESDDSNNVRITSVSVDSDTGTVRGRVTGPDGGSLSGAKVYLDSRTDTRTDAEGYYRFSNVPAGQHTVEVVYSGYISSSATVNIVSGETTRQDFKLQREEFTIRTGSEPVQVETTGDGTYGYGEQVTISAPATKNDYEFQQWTANGEVVSTSPEFTLDHLNRDYDLTAQYATLGTPDVRITSVRLSPENPTAGSNVQFEVILENQGDARAANLGIELSVGNSVFRAQTTIEPQSTRDVTIGPWTAETDASELSVTADFGDQIEETDETNNNYETNIDVATPTPSTTTSPTTESREEDPPGDGGGSSGPPNNGGGGSSAPPSNGDDGRGDDTPMETTAAPTTTAATATTTTSTTSTPSSTATTATSTEIPSTPSTTTAPTTTTSTPGEGISSPASTTETLTPQSDAPQKPASLTIRVETSKGTPVSAEVEMLTVDAGQRSTDDGPVTFDELNPDKYAIKIHSELFEGGSTTRTVQLEPGQNGLTVTTPRETTAYGKVALVNEQIGASLEELKVKIAGQEADVNDDGSFKIEGLSTGPHTVRVIYNGNALARHDKYLHSGGNELNLPVEAPKGFVAEFSETLSVYNRGMVFGEWGLTHPNTVRQSHSVPYFLGWMGGSIAPVTDVFADTRDCLVVSDDSAWQVMDCGGALASAAGSVSQVVGVLGAPVSFGGSLALAGAGAAVDTAEDVTDIATITRKFLRVTDVAHGKIAKALEGSLPIDLLRRVLDKLPAEVSSKLDEIIQGRRVSAFAKLDGVTEEQAKILAKADWQVSEVQKLLKNDVDSSQVIKYSEAGVDEAGFSVDQVLKLLEESRSVVEATKLSNNGQSIETIMKMATDHETIQSFARLNKGIEAIQAYSKADPAEFKNGANTFAEALTARKVINELDNAKHASLLSEVENSGTFVVTGQKPAGNELDVVIIKDGKVTKIYETRHMEVVQFDDVASASLYRSKKADQWEEIATSESGWAKYFKKTSADESRIEITAPEKSKIADHTKGTVDKKLDLTEDQIHGLYGTMLQASKKYDLDLNKNLNSN